MSHPHMTKKALDSIMAQIDNLDTLMDNLLMDGECNEDTVGIIQSLTTILKHEVELISVEDR